MSNKRYSSGDTVSCIGGGLHIPCTIINDDGGNYVYVLDNLTGLRSYIERRQIDFDTQWKRNERLKNLGI